LGEWDGDIRFENLVGTIYDFEALRLGFEIDMRQKRAIHVELFGFGFEQLFESGSWFDIWVQQRSP